MNLFRNRLREELQTTYAAVLDELDDHRESINDQARDSQEIRETLEVLDEKIEKLGSRLDEIYLLLGADTALNEQEKALAALLQTPRELPALASELGLTQAALERLLHVITLKGVTVHRYNAGESSLVTTNSALKGTCSLQKYL